MFLPMQWLCCKLPTSLLGAQAQRKELANYLLRLVGGQYVMVDLSARLPLTFLEQEVSVEVSVCTAFG